MEQKRSTQDQVSDNIADGIYLPYSPFLNPIEECWSKIKNKKKTLDKTCTKKTMSYPSHY